MNDLQDFIVVIPARYQSSRLPAKPLINILGIPMIIRTYRQCLQVVEANKIVVATDNEEIENLCRSHEINVVMTSSKCLTGTDRVAEVASILPAKTYINVQGDEPLFDPNDLLTLIDATKAFPDEVLNGYCPIDSNEMFRNRSIPKVVFTSKSKLLYISRESIPGNKENSFVAAHRQVCAYAYPREALFEFASTSEKSLLENIEDIEILRFLELGIEVRMIPMSSSSIAVDVLSDLSKVEDELRSRELGQAKDYVTSK